MALNEKQFYSSGQARWERLGNLCKRAENSPRALKGAELTEFINLYRQTCSDLAVVDTDDANIGLRQSLNDLVGRAHGIIYRRPQRPLKEALGEAILMAAQVMRRRYRFVLASIFFFIVGVTLSATTLATRPDLRTTIIPPSAEENFSGWKKGEFKPRGVDEGTMMWSFYATNNPRVAMISAGISAATFGLGTAYFMYENGVQIGALGYEMQSVHKLPYLLVSIFPHGASELTGMFVSGASGLVLGWALISPGRRTRGRAMMEEGKDAMVLMIQGVLMMFIAAPFEAFISFQPHVPVALKFAIGLVVLSAWLLFWTTYGRDKDLVGVPA